MAGGYARASSKSGVVLATSGPGFTNLITPIADALADGTPLVIFCGQVATSKIGLASFQEADTLEKYSFSRFDRKTTNSLVHPLEFIGKLSRITEPIKNRTVITTGVGQHQMWVAQHFRWKHPRTMITSGGLGTMGYGPPAAIGAKLARPDALVIDIDGDASFNMTFNELSTASQYNIGVKVIILNNEEQGMVKQLQHVYYDQRYTQCYHKNADYMGVAEAMGIQAQLPDQVDDYLQWLLRSDGPALLEVKRKDGLPVLPMVPSRKGAR